MVIVNYEPFKFLEKLHKVLREISELDHHAIKNSNRLQNGHSQRFSKH